MKSVANDKLMLFTILLFFCIIISNTKLMVMYLTLYFIFSPSGHIYIHHGHGGVLRPALAAVPRRLSIS